MNRGPIGQQGQQGMCGMPGDYGAKGESGCTVPEYPPYYWDAIRTYERCLNVWNKYAKITGRPLCHNSALDEYDPEYQMQKAEKHTRVLQKRITKHGLDK